MHCHPAGTPGARDRSRCEQKPIAQTDCKRERKRNQRSEESSECADLRDAVVTGSDELRATRREKPHGHDPDRKCDRQRN
jgi:hypothetical protein